MDRGFAVGLAEGDLCAIPDRTVRLGGRYVLGDLIGRGATAEVVRAHDERLRRDVAIKIFRRDSMADDARQRSEIEILASLSHPGLVTVFDAGNDDSDQAGPRCYLVLELIDGHSLGELLRDGPTSPHDAAAIGGQLAGALDYVHGKGITHRDVKPANVMLTSMHDRSDVQVVKLTDFGIARHVDHARMTLVGTTVGTAHYLSPEQASGGHVSGASDMYSLGLLLLECLTGELAYPGPGLEAALARLDHDPVIPDRFGPEWTRLLTALTARSPLDRPTAADAHRSLQRLAAAPPAQTSSVSQDHAASTRPPPPATARLPADHRPTRALRALLVGGVVAAVVTIVPISVRHTGSDTSTRPASPPAVTRPVQSTTASAAAGPTSIVLAPRSPASAVPANARPPKPVATSPASAPNPPATAVRGIPAAKTKPGNGHHKH